MCGIKPTNSNSDQVEIDSNRRQLCVYDKRVPIKCSTTPRNFVLASCESSHATTATRCSSRQLKVTNNARDDNDTDSNQSNESIVHATVDKIETVTQDVKCCVVAWKVGQDVWLLKHKVTTGIYDQIRILRAELHQDPAHAQGMSNHTGGEIRIKKDTTVWHEIWIYYLGADSNTPIKEFYRQFKTTENNVWKGNVAEKPTAETFSLQHYQAPSG